ncbi:LCP family protein [Niallia taxi]|uniref:LCP family protein n=1 Tax=Niallia taxi TaxID=2499688 RepID=UPI0015F6DE8A|nr:LCP family protein [Niallia taxi]
MKKKKIIKYTVLSLMAVILAVVGVGAISFYKSYQATLSDISVPHNNNDVVAKTPPVEEEEVVEPPKEEELELDDNILEKPFAMLLYGLDVRPGENPKYSRTDTIMVALVDPVTEKVSLISIPRDSYVQIPGYKKAKINSSIVKGGPELTIKTINQWLGTDIKEYAAIDFVGFEEVIDEIGGLDLNVDKSLHHGGVHLEPGFQHLNGEQTLIFVRHRLDERGAKYHSTDYDRMERQQYVLKELSKELLSFKTLFQINDMMEIVSDHTQTTLTPAEMNSLVKKFIDFDSEDLSTTSIQGNSIRINGGWYEDVPQSEVQRVQTLVDNFMDRTQQ